MIGRKLEKHPDESRETADAALRQAETVRGALGEDPAWQPEHPFDSESLGVSVMQKSALLAPGMDQLRLSYLRSCNQLSRSFIPARYLATAYLRIL